MAVDIQKLFNEDLPAAVARNPAEAKAIGHVFQVTITGENGGEWALDMTESGPSVKPGPATNPELTLTITDLDFQKLAENPQLNGIHLFLAKRLKMQGNQMLSMKLNRVFALANPTCCC